MGGAPPTLLVPQVSRVGWSQVGLLAAQGHAHLLSLQPRMELLEALWANRGGQNPGSGPSGGRPC